jgi:hypothetical protein
MELASIMEQAAETLLRQGSHSPTLIVEFEEKPTPIRSSLRFFPPPMEQKEEILYQRGKRLARHYGHLKVRRIFLVTEAWMNKPEPGRPLVAPALDPQREEALLVLELNASSPQFEQTFEGRKMIRNQEGKLIDLRPLTDLFPEGDEVEVTGVLLPAFLAGFMVRSPVYRDSDQLSRLLRHILLQKLRMEGLFMDNASS